MINTFIGKYKITRLIGEGGMAFVYEAEHEMLQTKVAIKVLKPMLSANSQIKERFKNEAKLMANLDHPNITKVIDFDEQSQGLSIIMEFLNGEDLNQKIKRSGPLSDQEIIDLYTQILSACQYAHEKGIVHRDIKPSNIFILPNGHLKILDFGIAKLFGLGNEMTHTGTQIGTPIYMSPEQVKADKSIDHRSDIYSLGVTLYYAINGKPPYNEASESQFDIFNKIVFEPLPNISKNSNFDEIISKASQKNRDQRFQSCKEFNQSMTELHKAIFESKNTNIIDTTIGQDKNNNDITENPEIINIKRSKNKYRVIITVSLILTFLFTGYWSYYYYKNKQLTKGIDCYNEKNFEEAFNIFNSDILKENALAQYHLGEMYSSGEFVEKNVEKAFLLATKSADQQNAMGLNLLGVFYRDSFGTEKNIEKALKYFTRAAEKGNPKAYCNLGDLYFNGDDGIERNLQKAINYYQEVIKLEKIETKNELSGYAEWVMGIIFQFGGDGVMKDTKKAIEYYSKAIEKNNAEAAATLGNMYEYGEDIEQNYFAAFRYYSISANLKNPDGQYHLGNLYLLGNGCTQNEYKAFDLFQKAADQGNSYAMAALGYMYEYNKGGARYDIEKAKTYYQRSADLGNEWAKALLGQ